MADREPIRIELMEEWRCSRCHQLLLKILPGPGTHIEIKCPRCKTYIARTIDFPRKNVVT